MKRGFSRRNVTLSGKQVAPLPLSSLVFREVSERASAAKKMTGRFARYDNLDHIADKSAGWSKNLLTRSRPWSYFEASDLLNALEKCEIQKAENALASADGCSVREFRRRLQDRERDSIERAARATGEVFSFDLDEANAIREANGLAKLSNGMRRVTEGGAIFSSDGFIRSQCNATVLRLIDEARERLAFSQVIGRPEKPDEDGKWIEQNAAVLYSRDSAPYIARMIARRLFNADLLRGAPKTRLQRAEHAILGLLIERRDMNAAAFVSHEAHMENAELLDSIKQFNRIRKSVEREWGRQSGG